MNARNWVRLFFSTLIIGGFAGMVTGLLVELELYKGIADFAVLGLWLFGVSCIFSLISQMGFFAYLTVHRFGLGIFRTVTLWNAVQIVLIAFVLFDLVYLRYTAFAEPGEAIWSYVVPALILFLIALIVAYLKQKETNRSAFVPALFFMTVVTTLEWFPVLRANDPSWVTIMFVVLVVSNGWQIMLLHRLTGQKAKPLNQS